jgi:hypothetical protein
MLTAADVAIVLSAWAVAWIASEPPAGALAGAVYRIGSPLGQPDTLVAVTAGVGNEVGCCGGAGISGTTVKKPQPLAHTFQSTPWPVESFVTAAVR